MTSAPSIVFFVVYWVLVLLMIGLVVFMFFSLGKKGDERTRHIKSKAMSNSFITIVAILFINVLWVMFVVMTGGSGSPYPFAYLFIVSLVFLISLIFNKRKHGD